MTTAHRNAPVLLRPSTPHSAPPPLPPTAIERTNKHTTNNNTPSAQAVITVIVARSTFVCAGQLLAVAFAVSLSGRCSHLTGLRRIVFMLLLSVLWILYSSLWLYFVQQADAHAKEGIFGFVILSAVSAVCFLPTYLVYHRRKSSFCIVDGHMSSEKC